MPRNVFTFVAGATAAGAVVLAAMLLRGSFDPEQSPASAAVRAAGPEQPATGLTAENRLSTSGADAESRRVDRPTNEQGSAAIGQESARIGGAVERSETLAGGQNLPIPVNSRELADHLNAPTVAPIHAEINGEAWDSGWASTTENQFASFYASQPELIVEYGNPVVHCRSTMCEIQVVAYGATPGNWLRLNRALFDQPWAYQFGEGPVGHGYAVSMQGEALVITQWVRRDESGTRSNQPASAVI